MKTMWKVLCMLALSVAFTAVASAHTEDNPYTTPLLAGQDIPVGEVQVWNDADNLYVTYQTDGEWCIKETHLHVSLEGKEGFPTAGPGNPKVGHFEYSGKHECVTTVTYSKNLLDEGIECGDEVYIAAHAVVCPVEGECETAWGEGMRFVERGNWAMYFPYTWQCEQTLTDTGTLTVAYEDKPEGEDNDYDYNDWVVDLETTATGVPATGGLNTSEIEILIRPEARISGGDHNFDMLLTESVFGASGAWALEDAGGTELASGSLQAGGTTIRIFDSTQDVLNNENETGDCPVPTPAYVVLTVTYDDPVVIDWDSFDVTLPHGSGLPFKPSIDNFDFPADGRIPGYEGDERILTVPVDWCWPTEATAIWNVYGGASSGVVQRDTDGTPRFDDTLWFETTPDSGTTSDCCTP